jgi:hypothetical protein
VVYYEANRNLSLKIGSGLSRQINPTKIDTWAEATKPSPAETGMLGYNTEIDKLELYDGATWQTFTQD